jgi:hypothetical protein
VIEVGFIVLSTEIKLRLETKGLLKIFKPPTIKFEVATSLPAN